MGKYAEFLPHLDDVIFYLKEKLKDPQLMKVSASKVKKTKFSIFYLSARKYQDVNETTKITEQIWTLKDLKAGQL